MSVVGILLPIYFRIWKVNIGYTHTK